MEPLTGEMQMALYTLAKKHSLAGGKKAFKHT